MLVRMLVQTRHSRYGALVPGQEIHVDGDVGEHWLTQHLAEAVSPEPQTEPASPVAPRASAPPVRRTRAPRKAKASKRKR